MHPEEQYAELTAEADNNTLPAPSSLVNITTITNISPFQHIHQFARGMHALCGLDIVAGVNGTRKTAEVTCPECLKVRESIETGYRIFKLKPEKGDVIIVGIGPQPDNENEFNRKVARALEVTESLRKDYPEVSFCILTEENKIDHLKEEEMEKLGWYRKDSIAKAGKKFSYKGGKLRTK